MTITVIEALAEATAQKKQKVTFEQFGCALGVSRQYINQIKDKTLSEKQIKMLEENLQINLTNVSTGAETVTLDYYPDMFGSCGNGVFALSPIKEKLIVPKKAFFTRFSPVKQYSVINAYGNSMEPFIYDKDKLIVEHWEGEQIIDNRPYIFSYKDEIFIKRLVKNINQLIIIPENKLYDTIKLSGEELKEINIIGQIVGLMRDLR